MGQKSCQNRYTNKNPHKQPSSLEITSVIVLKKEDDNWIANNLVLNSFYFFFFNKISFLFPVKETTEKEL